MATYVTKKCPHCGYPYQIHQKSSEQRKYGCPYQTCIRCNNSYWDTDIKEPALYGYRNAHEIKNSILSVISYLLFTLLGLKLLVIGIRLLVARELIGILALAMGGYMSWSMISFCKRKLNELKHKDEIVAEQQRNYDASLERLKNTRYLTFLAEYDSRAYKILLARANGQTEHYAQRPE